MSGKRAYIELGEVPKAIENRLMSDSFQVVANQTEEEIELLVMGIVGSEYDALDSRSVVALLAENPGKRVRVRIDSPGGLLFDGLTIHNALVKHDAEVVTEIEGMAASAAAIIAVAGDTVRMAENGELFIHRAMGIALGNAVIMQDMAELLAKADRQIAKTFAAKTGKASEAMMRLMEGKVDGTVFDADEALEIGFVDELIPIRRDKGEDSEAENAAATAVESVVPRNPPGGDGEGKPGRWRKPSLGDFTDKSWDDLDGSEKRSIARHYSWYSDLDNFGNLKLPHHFPPSSRNNRGKASVNGARNALSRLPQTQGIPENERERVEAHLRAHLPAEDRAKDLAEFRDANFADDLRDRQVEWEQRMLERSLA